MKSTSSRNVLALGALVGLAALLAGCQSKQDAPVVPAGAQAAPTASQAKIPAGMTGTASDTFVKPEGK